MDKRLERQQIIPVGLLCIGILLRFIVMTLGHNFDFDSYCIVGEIAGSFRNVYAETSRYNYGPIFFCIQGLLYRVSHIRSSEWVLLYRVLMVSVLTMADYGIAIFIATKYSNQKAILFFLNPISIIITGYHNQFDNLAILFALLSTNYYNKSDCFDSNDLKFIVMLSISLITKHILVFVPLFILLKKNLPIKKKIAYSFIPPALFLISFVPFALSSKEALNGILENVFRYRSFNNAPLLAFFYDLIGFPDRLRFFVYVMIMIVVAWDTKESDYERTIMIYLISMVAFSSAITNQYLVIPMAALCVLNVGKWNYIYMFVTGIFLIQSSNGLHMNEIVNRHLTDGGIISRSYGLFVDNGYVFAAWILLFSLLYIRRNRIEKTFSPQVV